MQRIYLLTLFFIGCAIANIDNANNLNDEISGLADKLPSELTDKLPLNGTNVPSVEDAQKLFKEKCRKLTNSDEAYEKAFSAKDVLETCVKKFVNVSELQVEIENAKPTGDLDTVFGKYCAKAPSLMTCVKDFLTSVDPCLEEKEKENKKMVLNMTESLIDFVCYRDGDRIAMFIAEGGVECLSSKQDAMQTCANNTLGKKIPTEMPTVDNLPLFVIGKEQCDDLSELQRCIVGELEKCKEPTPANIVDALFKFIRKVTPCVCAWWLCMFYSRNCGLNDIHVNALLHRLRKNEV
ncbi:uncharacterized protein CBL_10261 [Carabus blaptoides fortunei]